MNITKAFKSKYLRACDIEAPFVATVEDVFMAQFEDGEKPALTLDSGQTIILNRTRSNALENGFGTSETEEWLGRRVEVSTERVPFHGKPVDAIKLAVPPAAVPPAAVPVTGEADNTDIPF